MAGNDTTFKMYGSYFGFENLVFRLHISANYPIQLRYPILLLVKHWSTNTQHLVTTVTKCLQHSKVIQCTLRFLTTSVVQYP